MAGESIGCASRKKHRSKQDDKSDQHDENGDSLRASLGKTTRGGLRVYKIVILGDGGVGKSGKYLLYFPQPMSGDNEHIRYEGMNYHNNKQQQQQQNSCHSQQTLIWTWRHGYFTTVYQIFIE